MGKYYFLASVLPVMPADLGEKLPHPFAEIAGIIQRNIEPDDASLVQSILFSIDVANFEAIHQGRDIFIEGGTLAREEIESKRNLPLFMRNFLDEKDRGIRRSYIFDALWERYYAYSYSLAQEMGCRFLADYLAWEIGLRNQLVALRAKEKRTEAEDYILLPHVGGHDLTALIAHVKSQKNPLLAERALDEERLRQVFHCEGDDPFSLNAVLAALERARIFSRWEKMDLPCNIEDII
ncbi:MAG TPA: DUF2764 family protein [Syntrophorhabdaceae bacterium]|jgi:hypothetical protein|nr:DUF2764 family protein [Syntrophorhabdaceae bacterium]HNT68676.1 DUF2764 family protein [Syntrophorhabdaceae bacterium]